MQQQNTDLQQAAQWLHSHSIPLNNSTRKCIPQYLICGTKGPISLCMMVFYTNIEKISLEVDLNLGYSSSSHHI